MTLSIFPSSAVVPAASFFTLKSLSIRLSIAARLTCLQKNFLGLAPTIALRQQAAGSHAKTSQEFRMAEWSTLAKLNIATLIFTSTTATFRQHRQNEYACRNVAPQRLLRSYADALLQRREHPVSVNATTRPTSCADDAVSARQKKRRRSLKMGGFAWSEELETRDLREEECNADQHMHNHR
jgi:hypothetical protein